MPETIFVHSKHFKNDENLILFQLKSSFWFSRYLKFCLDILVMKKKWLEWKDKVSFKTLAAQPDLLINNYNTNTDQYHKK